MYLFPVDVPSKQKCAICRVMRKTCILKVRRYAAYLIGLNEYLSALPREKASGKICETELMKCVWEACQMAGSVKHLCRGLIVNPLL